MTDKEVMQMALETLDNMVKVDWREWDEFASVEDFVRWAKSRASFTAEALRAALAQPEREWQGLTDEEVDEAEKEFGVWRGRVAKQSFESGAWWANEKLLEKNT